MPPDPLKYLFDVQRAAALILEFVQGRTQDDYLADVMLRAAVEREFITIGEALNQARHAHPTVLASISDAQRIIDFRNVMVHGYDSIDVGTVWDVIQNHLPQLKFEVDALLAKASGDP